MHIICPHCTTTYAIELATLGVAGRTVRCSRCKEVWLAQPQDAIESRATVAAMAEANEPAGNSDIEWDQPAHQDDSDNQEAPVVDSPSISAELPDSAEGEDTHATQAADWPSVARQDIDARAASPKRPSWFRRLRKPTARPGAPGKPLVSLTTVCAGMGALVLALTIWRVDVVRLLPQTALFYRMVGLDVNVRGLAFKDVKVSTETVEGKPVLVIEGVIVGQTRKPVELPRLRFSVRDAQGSEIYAWNAVLEQSVLKPGEKAWFKSRLASPPQEGRNIDVRFFSKRDIAGGSV